MAKKANSIKELISKEEIVAKTVISWDTLKISLVKKEGAITPSYATLGSAGMDVYAYLPDGKFLLISPGQSIIVPTGLNMAIPKGFEVQVRSRSGLAHKLGLQAVSASIILTNEPGTIDSDYRGEVGVIIRNLSSEKQIVNHKERICQLVLARYTVCEFIEVDSLDETDRGAGGFGSTGK